MMMQFVDLESQQKRIKARIIAGINDVLAHGKYIMGPEVKKLEEVLATFANTRFAVSCASGTDALLMALMAHGVGPGDAVLIPPFTFIATAEVISLLGATPVFVDVNEKNYNIDPIKLDRALQALDAGDDGIYPLPRLGKKASITPRGIIAVDLFGLPSDYEAIQAVAKSHGLFLIGDAAQSFGAEINGVKACCLPDVACTSFFPAKPLGCYGDGGMCFTDDEQLAEKLRSIRVHGKGTHKYDNARIGINGRLDCLQAAILLAKNEIFPEEIELRQQVARRYTALLSRDGAPRTPYVPAGFKSVWAQYSLVSASGQAREAYQASLKEARIPNAVYYPNPLHLQGAFRYLGYRKGDFQVSELLSERIFSLPMHPYLTEEDQETVVRRLLA